MKLIDLGYEVSLAAMAYPAAVTATGALGNKIDLQGYQGKVRISFNLGAVSGTNPTLDLKVQDSADNITFADLAAPVAFGQKAAANANSGDSIVVDTRACRRYLQLYATIGGTAAPTFTFSCTMIGQKQTI